MFWPLGVVTPDRLHFRSAPNQGSPFPRKNRCQKSPEDSTFSRLSRQSTRRLIRVCPPIPVTPHALRGRPQILPHEIPRCRQRHICALHRADTVEHVTNVVEGWVRRLGP